MAKHRKPQTGKHSKSRRQKVSKPTVASKPTDGWQQAASKGKRADENASPFRSRPRSVEKTYWRH